METLSLRRGSLSSLLPEGAFCALPGVQEAKRKSAVNNKVTLTV